MLWLVLTVFGSALYKAAHLLTVLLCSPYYPPYLLPAVSVSLHALYRALQTSQSILPTLLFACCARSLSIPGMQLVRFFLRSHFFSFPLGSR